MHLALLQTNPGVLLLLDKDGKSLLHLAVERCRPWSLEVIDRLIHLDVLFLTDCNGNIPLFLVNHDLCLDTEEIRDVRVLMTIHGLIAHDPTQLVERYVREPEACRLHTSALGLQ
jgi:hypothetical protein